MVNISIICNDNGSSSSMPPLKLKLYKDFHCIPTITTLADWRTNWIALANTMGKLNYSKYTIMVLNHNPNMSNDTMTTQGHNCEHCWYSWKQILISLYRKNHCSTQMLPPQINFPQILPSSLRKPSNHLVRDAVPFTLSPLSNWYSVTVRNSST